MLIDTIELILSLQYLENSTFHFQNFEGTLPTQKNVH